MDRQPNGGRIGLRRFHAMADVSGYLHPVAGPQVEVAIAFLEAQNG
jgi:hypothetical protein